MRKIIVDEWGEMVKPHSVHQGKDGGWYEITDLCPEERYPVGAVFEEGCEDDEGDYFTAEFLRMEVKNVQ